MIITESYPTEQGQTPLKKTFSSAGMKIKDENGNLYNEAVDPVSVNKTYIETDYLIDQDEENLAEVLRILFGGREVTDE